MDKLEVVRIEVAISVSKIREDLIYQNKQCLLLNDIKQVSATYGMRAKCGTNDFHWHTE